MGTLAGHILPGSFFLTFGLWWTWSVYFKYFLSQRDNAEEGGRRRRRSSSKYKNTVSFPCVTCHRLPLEGIIKVAVTSIGMIGELATAFRDGHLVNYGNVHHMTMYFFFGLNGAMDIVTFYSSSIVPDLDFVTGILAFVAEGILFLYHEGHENKIGDRLHLFLVYIVFATAISCLCEMMFRTSVLAALCRVFFTLFQGTWFIQVGFVLYVFKWDGTAYNQMKTLTLMFAWHMGSIFLFLLVAGYVIRYRVKRVDRSVAYEVIYPCRQMQTRYFGSKGFGEENIVFTDSEEL